MRHIKICGASLVLASLVCGAAAAYDTLLSPEAVREAYFLGQRNDAKTAAFLGRYTKHLPLPKSGPYVSEIELFTPYAQLIQISQLRTIGYSAQQAERDYHKQGDTLRVRVLIRFTPTYGLQAALSSSQRAAGKAAIRLRAEDFWRDFTIHFIQRRDGEEKTIKPFGGWSEPHYVRTAEGGSVLDGADLWLLFDAADVASAPAKIDVLTPDGQHVVSAFDLEKLK